MRESFGRPFTLAAAAVSAVVCAGVCGLWARSCRTAYAIPWDAVRPGRAGWRVESMRGGLYVRRVSPPSGVTATTRPPRGAASIPPNGYGLVDGGREYVGGLFATGDWAVYRNGTTAPCREVRISYAGKWLLTLPAAAWAVRHLLRDRGERQLARRGLCPKCGYDIRATPGRRPECGAVPPVSAAGKGAA